jgi:hypothetical protein
MREGLEKKLSLPTLDPMAFDIIYEYLSACINTTFKSATQKIARSDFWRHAGAVLDFAQQYEIEHLTNAITAVLMSNCDKGVPADGWKILPRAIDLAITFNLSRALEFVLVPKFQFCLDRDREECEASIDHWKEFPKAAEYIVGQCDAAAVKKHDIILKKILGSVSPDKNFDSVVAEGSSLVHVHFWYVFDNSFDGKSQKHWAKGQVYRHQPLGNKFVDILQKALNFWWKGAQHETQVKAKDFALGIFRAGNKKCDRFLFDIDSISLDSLGFPKDKTNLDVFLDWDGGLRNLSRSDEDDGYVGYFGTSHHDSRNDDIKTVADILNGSWTYGGSGKRPTLPEGHQIMPNEPLNGPYVAPNVDSQAAAQLEIGFPQGSYLVLSNSWHEQWSVLGPDGYTRERWR